MLRPVSIRAGSGGGSRRFVLLSALTLAACTTRPIPLAVQPGGSFVVPLAMDSHLFPLGFESEVSRARGRYDAQRGEVLFLLLGPDGSEHPLVTRWLTRAWPDPASPAGIANALPEPVGHMTGQVLALVEVPAGVPPGDYSLEARRLRRTSPDGGTPPESLGGVFDLLLPPTELGELSVLPGLGKRTPLEGLFASLELDATGVLADLVPYPRVVVGFGVRPLPAAAHMIVAYPAERIEVLSVFEEGHLGRGSILRWRDDPEAAELAIDLVDPDRSVRGVAIAFRLRDPFGAGRAEVSDFTLLEANLYDSDGNPIGSEAAASWVIL